MREISVNAQQTTSAGSADPMAAAFGTAFESFGGDAENSPTLEIDVSSGDPMQAAFAGGLLSSQQMPTSPPSANPIAVPSPPSAPLAPPAPPSPVSAPSPQLTQSSSPPSGPPSGPPLGPPTSPRVRPPRVRHQDPHQSLQDHQDPHQVEVAE